MFNKGKASAKTVVKKNKLTSMCRGSRDASRSDLDTEPYLKLFSEDRFLSKTPGHKQGNDVDSDASDDQHEDRDHDHNHSEDSALAPRAKPRKKQVTPPRTIKAAQKRARSPSSASGSSSDDEKDLHRPQLDPPPPNKSHKRPRAQSPMWDIELDEGKLPSESDPDTSVVPRAETKADGTVILDMRITGAKWLSTAQEKQPRMEEVMATEDVVLGENRSETSSIAPENSASQTASRRPDLDACGVSMFSKYFSALDPPVVEHTVSYDRADASPPPQPILQHTSATHGGNLIVTEDPSHQDAPDAQYRPTSGGSATVHVQSVALTAPRLVERSVSPPVPCIYPRSPLVSTSPLGFLSGPPSPALSEYLVRPAAFDSSVFTSARERHHTSGAKRQQPRPKSNHSTLR